MVAHQVTGCEGSHRAEQSSKGKHCSKPCGQDKALACVEHCCHILRGYSRLLVA